MATTTDFTGTYDYAREEAKYAAQSILDGVADDYYDAAHPVQAAIQKELLHWRRILDDADYADFENEFSKCLSTLKRG